MPAYNLIYLIDRLKDYGLNRWCLNHKISANKECLLITYFDSFLEEQFIFVFRTSRLGYRIFCRGELTLKRTCKDAAEFLIEQLSDIINTVDYYNVMTVAEMCSMSAKKKSEIWQRMDELRYRKK